MCLRPPAGCTLQETRFVPPTVPDMEKSLEELELFFYEDDLIPPLIKIALIHAQFESIHPFLDDHVIIRTKLEKPSKINGLALI